MKGIKIKEPKVQLNKPKLQKPKIHFNLRLIVSLVRKELSGYFSSPIAYIILGLFVIIVSIIFFGIYQYLRFGTADLTQMFTSIAFSFIIIVPALTMGSVSKEKQTGTIEYALTQPIAEFQFILSKFLSFTLILIILLALTLPLSLVIGSLAPLDFGQVVMQYIGAFILGLCFIAIGVSISTFFKSDIAALLVSLLISVLFIITGSQLLNFFPLEFQSLIERLSLLSHYQSISRGVVDLRDILYFIAFISFFSILGYYALVKDKFPQGDKSLRNLRIVLVIFIVISVGIGVLGQLIPGRIDFTSNQKYTLSEPTREVLNNIQDNVTIEFYASGSLPLEFQALKRDVDDTLRDYALYSNGKITVVNFDPQSDSSAADRAETAGLQRLVFAVDTQDASQRVEGYLGLVFKYKDKTEIINLTNNVTSDLEYQISKNIKKISVEDKIDVAFLSNNVSQTSLGTYNLFSKELREVYDVQDITLTKDKLDIPENIQTIIIPGPSQKFDSEVIKKLKEFYNNGGSIILLSDTIQISEDSGTPKINENSLKDFFAESGVTLNENFVYDLAQNNLIGIGQGMARLPVEYPLWFIANSTSQTDQILKNVSNISILWGGDISVDESKLNGNTLYRLFETTDYANVQTVENINISAVNQFTQKEDDSKRLIAVAIENPNGGRAVVVGDSDFLTDDVIYDLNSRQQGLDALNLSFGVGSVEWASKDNQLSSIKARNRLPIRIAIEGQQTAMLLGFGIALPIVLIIGSGVFKLYRRRKLTTKKYEA